MTRVLFVGETPGSSCREMRMEIPAEGLRLLGYDVDVCSGFYENADGKIYGFDHTENRIPCPGVVIVRHVNGPNGEALDSSDIYLQARKNEQTIFYDMDDDAWNLPASNPAAAWNTPELHAIVMRNINACDALIVSTDSIKAEAEEHGVNVPIHVLSNGVQPHRYTPKFDEYSPLRLAWFGSPKWRMNDFALCLDGLYKALDGKRGQVQFWHVGLQEDEEPIFDTLQDFPVETVQIPWVSLNRLPWMLSQIDCAVLPMEDTKFNRARSNDMGLRFATAGVVFAASPLPEYQKLFVKGCGTLGYENDWEHSITTLVEPEYEQYRRDIRLTGYQVAHQYNEVHTAEKYRDMFNLYR